MRRTNPKDKFYIRLKDKLIYMGEDFIEYVKDVFLGRTDPFIYKTADFYHRNKKSMIHHLCHIWEELVKVGRGFRALKNDFLYFFSVHKSKISYKYDAISYKQEVKIKQVKTDFIKFIPFSLFIIVPGLELLLPAWLMIFPNSIPS